MSNIIKGRFVQKHDTEANWDLATNFSPLRGEVIVYDPDATHAYSRFKIGDGTTNVNDLPFLDAGTLSGASLSTTLNSSDVEIPTSKLVFDNLENKLDKVNPTGTGVFSLNRKTDTTIGQNSVAEGTNTTASGDSCHAEGIETIATRLASHAEGYKTNANFTAAHTEGYETYAGGTASHAEGYQTRVNSDYSHAEGIGTKVYGSQAQHVQGRYNIYDTSHNYAHILGNGTETAESNAHTIDWSGNAWFAGDVKVGGTGQDDAAAKILATTDAIPTKTSELTNDSGFKTTDNNTTYSLSKSGSTITLTGSDGSTTTVTDDDTQYTLPVATDSILGGIKSGGDISVDATGIVTVKSGVYVQQTEPTDAEDGAVWVDTATDPEVYIGLPDVTAADNGKVLQVVNGLWTVTTISTIPTLDESGVLIF